MTWPPSDAALVAAFAASDPKAGDALFARHAAEIRAFLRARCGSLDVAADLTQEVAWRLVRAGLRLDPRRDTTRAGPRHDVGHRGRGPPLPAPLPRHG